MATLIDTVRDLPRDQRFFLRVAVAMAIVMVAGFSLQAAMGRSSFGAPLHIHVHAVFFFGWVLIYLLQNILVSRDNLALHRRLGWIAVGWAVAMVPIGIYTTVVMVQRGAAPFFFLPAYFLVMNALMVLTFAGFVAAAVINRRRTAWHRRLIYCGMAVLTAPAFGRLLPAPLMIPNVGWGVFAAIMIWPVVGILADLMRAGRVHPAWWWGVAAMIAMQLAIETIGNGGAGIALYEAITDGTPGATVAPLAYPPFPPL
ncbi:hypothetical protein [Sphingomonas sp. G-3-2-10]|uniref:hypothetical protein n=1 Tax=Sphingomonas sp. G-3-2-10 TaxID=2728838 RepID=UPI00146C0E11|nr:hypothetical protein [Sphingomonas sp. G-3-2-10]NML06343.1 hypothetical protein [Sphingomonas sp. G-3-2-10]